MQLQINSRTTPSTNGELINFID